MLLSRDTPQAPFLAWSQYTTESIVLKKTTLAASRRVKYALL